MWVVAGDNELEQYFVSFILPSYPHVRTLTLFYILHSSFFCKAWKATTKYKSKENIKGKVLAEKAVLMIRRKITN